MKKVSQSSLEIVYRQQPTVMLYFALMNGLILAGGIVFPLPLAAKFVLALFVGVGLIVGLGRDQLVLDLARGKLHYEERMAGFVIRNVDGDFTEVASVLVNDVSIQKPEPGVTRIHPGWAVELKYTGAPPTGISIGIFATRDDAMAEARMLSDGMKRPIEELDLTP